MVSLGNSTGGWGISSSKRRGGFCKGACVDESACGFVAVYRQVGNIKINNKADKAYNFFIDIVFVNRHQFMIKHLDFIALSCGKKRKKRISIDKFYDI